MTALTRIAAAELPAAVCDAAAHIFLEHGPAGLRAREVADRAGITRSRLLGLYRGQNELMVALHACGHARISAVCAQHPRVGVVAMEAVIALAYDLVEQSDSDPVARALYGIESTPHAAGSSLASIYRVWHEKLRQMLGPNIVGSAHDPILDDTHCRRVSDAVESLVAALAGFCDPRRDRRADTDVFERLHLVLVAILPSVCSDDRQGQYLRQYLGRVHEHAHPAPAVEVPKRLVE